MNKKCLLKRGCLYIKGRKFEYQAVSILKKMGFQVIYRSPRSRGIFDIFALKGSPLTNQIVEARYIQVKASRSCSPLKSIVSKEERERIMKNKMVVIIGKKTFYEIWIRRLNKRWDIYRLNWASKEFDCLREGKGFKV